MQVKTEERWLKWDKMMNKGDYISVVKEFDSILLNNGKIVIGDIIRRDQSLEVLGVSLIRKNAIYQRGYVKK